MKKIHLTLLITLTFTTFCFSQDDQKPSPFSVNGYLETYYVYDFNKPENNTRPGFVYSYNRHNEVNLNLGFVRGSYNTDNVRANLALMAGTYANANLVAEPGVLKNVFEANAGVKLSSTKNLWVDAGIFGSHIGFESAVGKDCWNLTRSILADNTPYYEAGAKVSYTTDNGKWFLSGLVLNGWQRIQRVEGNSLLSFGTQITFKPSDKVTLNGSSFIGTDKADSARQMRYFHNFYGMFRISDAFGLIVGFDYGVEEKGPESSATNAWYSPIMIARYKVSDKVAVAVRGEYYDDKNGVIIPTCTPNGFRTIGVSANFDYQISPNALWRVEVRSFSSKDEVFVEGTGSSKNNTFVATSLAVSF
ncbi:outer membrane beta-barrel protein [Fulvivirgaceae bacterium PWU4]|uniref:Outer membrane beta-barrel protein n=1 Tax=Chryseosolibacter histidini TaxID=2782349 RepID=A0AAP2DM56_9BACT|nr:porin [Chryseosolibacter histidini]MBT1698840.1 outer membrane beta-barrel protein [Chryseosolibacter histidini]